MTEATLAEAQAGDGEAFRELVEPYRGELQAHCYQILGSVADAEDVLQEVPVGCLAVTGPLRRPFAAAWLYRIATNRCLNYLRGQSRHPRPAGPPDPGSDTAAPMPSGDPWWLEPYPDVLLSEVTRGPEARYDARESIALAFVAGLPHLPPQRRAVLVLRDVLGFPASILGTTSAAVNSALIRARAGLRADRDPHDVPLPRSAAEAAVVSRFVDAFERFDLDKLVALLTEDARLTMPPEPAEFRGSQAIASYLQHHLWGQELKLVLTRANNQPAVVYYHDDPCAPIWRAGSLVVLTLRETQACALTRFGDRGLLARFGLPRTLRTGHFRPVRDNQPVSFLWRQDPRQGTRYPHQRGHPRPHRAALAASHQPTRHRVDPHRRIPPRHQVGMQARHRRQPPGGRPRRQPRLPVRRPRCNPRVGWSPPRDDCSWRRPIAVCVRGCGYGWMDRMKRSRWSGMAVLCDQTSCQWPLLRWNRSVVHPSCWTVWPWATTLNLSSTRATALLPSMRTLIGLIGVRVTKSTPPPMLAR
jgi:RNA polymerase sigma-70 factor (ECF subfamily)